MLMNILNYSYLFNYVGKKVKMKMKNDNIIEGKLSVLRTTGYHDTSLTLENVEVKNMRYGAVELHDELTVYSVDVASIDLD